MKGDLELKHCRVLLAVSKHGGIVKAGKSLGLAQSTVSETLISFERVVGGPLFHRRVGEGARLTALAEHLLPYAAEIVAAADRVERAARNWSSALPLNVGAVESISSYLLPQCLSALRASRPDSKVQIWTSTCDTLRAQVAQGVLDAAFTLGAEDDGLQSPSYLRQALTPARIALVCVPGFLAGCDGAINIRELSKIRVIAPDPEGSFHNLLLKWFMLAGSHPDLVSAGSVDGVKRVVLDGGAIGALPVYALREELTHGILLEITPKPQLPSLLMECVIPSRGESSPVVSELVGLLKGCVLV